MSALAVALDEPNLDRFLWPGIAEQDWLGPFALPKIDPEFLRFFDNLAFDQYAPPNTQRWRRFSQFLAFHSCQGELVLQRLPHRPFIQSKKYNPLAGGIPRWFEPLELNCDITPFVQQKFDLLRINRSQKYHIDIHLYRVDTQPDLPGTSVPEGAHSDGMQIVAIDVLERRGVTENSARFSMLDPNTRELLTKPFVVQAGYGVLLNDRKMLHDADPVVASGTTSGHRSYLVMNINEWGERRYGREHERLSMPDGSNIVSFPEREPRVARLRRGANFDFERIQERIAVGDTRVLSFANGLANTIKVLGTYEGLKFTATDFTEAHRQALILSANALARAIDDARGEGDYRHGPRMALDKRLEALAAMEGGMQRAREEGLVDRRLLKRIETEPRLWRLQRAAPTLAARQHLDMRRGRMSVCL